MGKKAYYTKDINEATYYVLHGYIPSDFKIEKIRSRKYANSPKIVQEKWTIYFVHVPLRFQRAWADCKIEVNIRQFMEVRKQLKRMIYNQRSGKFVNNFIDHI